MWKKKKKIQSECGICFQHKKVILDIEIYKNKDTKCTINHPYCQHCLSKHIVYKIKETKTPNIQCPGCPEPLDPVGCSRILSPPVFLAWTKLLAESLVNQSNSRRIVCPYHGCREVLLVDEVQSLHGCSRGKPAASSCPWCSRLLCYLCGTKWTPYHPRDCVVNVDNVFLDAARRMMLQRCPSCRFFIERAYGCDAIRCRCGQVFCYKCGSNTSCIHTPGYYFPNPRHPVGGDARPGHYILNPGHPVGGDVRNNTVADNILITVFVLFLVLVFCSLLFSFYLLLKESNTE